MKIAILSPIAWRTHPPQIMVPEKQVAANLTEGIDRQKTWRSLYLLLEIPIPSAKLEHVTETAYAENPDMEPRGLGMPALQSF